MIKHVFVFIALCSIYQNTNAQTDFPALKQQFLDYRKADKQDSALFTARKMNQLALTEQSDTSFWYALSMRYQGDIYYDGGNNDSAHYYWQKSVDLFEKYHPNHSEYASSLNNLGIVYSDMGDFKAAEPYYKQALEIIKNALGEDHPDYASSLNTLGMLYRNMGYYNVAKPYHEQALEIRKNALGEDHLDYASSLSSLGNLYKNLGDYKSAEYYYRKGLEINKKIRGEVDPSYSRSLNNLGYLYSESGKYDSSMVLIKQSIEILWNHFKDSAKLINRIHSLAYVLHKSGKYLEAQDNYLKAIGLLNSGHSIKKSFIYYYDLSENYIRQSKYDQALRILINLDSVCRDNNLMLETGDLKYLFGKFYSMTGKYILAKEYYLKALEIRENFLPVNHPDIAVSYNSVGVIFRKNGDYKAAELCFKKALEIRKVTLGEDHSDYAMTLNNLGHLYKIMGDYQAAEQYYKQAMDIRKNVLGDEHPDFAICLSNLGVLYYDMQDYYAAKLFVEKAYEIKKKAYEKDHTSLGFSLHTLGKLYKIMGDYKSAKVHYQQALEIRKKALGEEHPDYASSLDGLGDLYINMGDYKAAEPYYQQALGIYQKALGKEHPDYLSTENSFAYLLMKTDRGKQAYEILSENFKKKSRETTDNFEWLNDNQKDAYWKKESSFYDKLTWFSNAVYEKVPEAVGLNYNAALITKSKMLEAKISSENYYREVDEIREELAYRRRLLAKMESDGAAEKDKLEKLHKEADSLDKRLISSWPEYAQQKKNLSITWDQVQQNLDKSDAAIEFVRFYNENDSLYYYNALVLKKGDKNPILIKLCKEKDLQSISPKMGYSAYYPLVWQPMEAVLKEVKTIYYAPTGEMYNVPFHAIYSPTGKGDELRLAKTDKRGVFAQNENALTEQNAEYLMDRYTMHQLTSTRYLAIGLKQKAQEPIAKSIALVGGVNYDFVNIKDAKQKRHKGKSNSLRSSQSASGKLAYLEGTKWETETIKDSVQSKQWKIALLSSNDATEDNLMRLEGKHAKSILHIATHGYAFPEFDFKDTSISKNSLRYSYRYSINPMVRSGLILAGGNWAWTGSDTLTKLGAEQNGILTALEVSQLNLKKTKLVVLSACETGLGKTEGSEGIFGLKRGFKLAGVEQIIVSLWSVPDKETMELMTLFYSDLTKTLNPVLSFEKAQKEMRNKYPTDPEKWAGFVLVR